MTVFISSHFEIYDSPNFTIIPPLSPMPPVSLAMRKWALRASAIVMTRKTLAQKNLANAAPFPTAVALLKWRTFLIGIFYLVAFFGGLGGFRLPPGSIKPLEARSCRSRLLPISVGTNNFPSRWNVLTCCSRWHFRGGTRSSSSSSPVFAGPSSSAAGAVEEGSPGEGSAVAGAVASVPWSRKEGFEKVTPTPLLDYSFT